MAYIRVWVELPPWHRTQKAALACGVVYLFVCDLTAASRKDCFLNWAKNLMPGSLYLSHPMTQISRPPRPIQWLLKIHKPLMPSCDKYLLMAFQKLLRSNLYIKDPSILLRNCLVVRLITRQILVGDTLQITQLHTCLYKILWLFLGIFQPLSGNSLMVSFRTHDSSPCFRAPALMARSNRESKLAKWSEIYEAQQLAVASCKLEKNHLRFFMLWMEKSVGVMLK